MDLTFEVPMQPCFLQHWTLLPSPVMSTTKCCFCFSSICSFFLEIFLHWSPVAYRTLPTWGVHLSLSYLIFPFHTVRGVLKQDYWSGLQFASPVDHVLSKLSTTTRSSWVALHGMAPSFIELDNAVVHVISLIRFLWFCVSFCLSSDGEG